MSKTKEAKPPPKPREARAPVYFHKSPAPWDNTAKASITDYNDLDMGI